MLKQTKSVSYRMSALFIERLKGFLINICHDKHSIVFDM